MKAARQPARRWALLPLIPDRSSPERNDAYATIIRADGFSAGWIEFRQPHGHRMAPGTQCGVGGEGSLSSRHGRVG